jgi:hypothetical protein
MTEEDYWGSDPDFDAIIETAAAQGELLLTEPESKRPTFRDYHIKPLYEQAPWQPGKTYYMVTLWGNNLGRLFDSYEDAFKWLRQQLEANNDDLEQI